MVAIADLPAFLVKLHDYAIIHGYAGRSESK